MIGVLASIPLYALMRRTGRPRLLPLNMTVSVTYRCNSRCQTCVRTFGQLEPLRNLSLSEFRGIVDQFPTLDRIVLHGIGEPLLNPELGAMIRHAKEKHPSATVLFNSNAILLDEEWQRALIDAGLDEYRVSLDATTAETYVRIRGINAFEAVVANLRGFVHRLGKAERPRLSLWMMALRENLSQLPALVDLADDLGVPEVYVQRLVLLHRGLAQEEQSLHGRLREQEEALLADAAQRARAYGITFRASGLSTPQESLRSRTEGRPYAACHRLWTTTYITANGNVLPCCISPFSTTDYASLILGNVFRSPFAQIWNGERYAERRAALYTAHPLHPCEQCGVNWAL